MNHSSHVEEKKQYSLSDFFPLIVIFSIIIGFTFFAQYFYNFDLRNSMRVFMGLFFIIFGSFKLINLGDFAQAYAQYDLLAQQSRFYALLYPFLELMLGALYLVGWYPTFTNIFTFILMSVSAAGVFNELRKGHQIVCACLGTVFKVPMTYVTLVEDLLMAFMALWMLLF